MKLLTETNEKLINICVLLLRLTVGVILFGIGTGKVFGWFGGYGLEQTVQGFTAMGIPAYLAYLSTFTELIGGLLLIIGLLTRPAAFAITINMFVATLVTLPAGFFVTAAYPLSLMMSSLIILLAGPMGYSLDSMLLAKSNK